MIWLLCLIITTVQSNMILVLLQGAIGVVGLIGGFFYFRYMIRKENARREAYEEYYEKALKESKKNGKPPPPAYDWISL